MPSRLIIPLDFQLGPWPADEFYRDAHREGAFGLVMPKRKTPAFPKYTSDALQRKTQGVVEVEVVVASDGIVSRARVTKSLDRKNGLDDEALIAAWLTTFEPGTLNGTPVPVLVTVTMEFKLDGSIGPQR